MLLRTSFAALLVPAILFLSGLQGSAVSPSAVQQGRQLFEKNWQHGNPGKGGDGLGPLFNGQSCVACHHQGGVGGGGESEFNAITIGIEEMSIKGGPVDDEVIARMLRTFHPGFVQRGGGMVNTLVLTHHGGSPLYKQVRQAILDQTTARHSKHGGPESAEETRFGSATPILFTKHVAPYTINIKARVFYRNTTSLFGDGVIDQIPAKLILDLAKKQKRHSEVSGRPSTMNDGRIGKFGWRANVVSLIEFNDQACANEVGLKTRRKPQPIDPMTPGYRNPRHDVEDKQVEMLNLFVAMLPAPVRQIPESTSKRMLVGKGERAFEKVGCAVCHVPNVGPASGIYSDLLLHDMGGSLMDLNHAEPYRIRATPFREVSRLTESRTTGQLNTTGYYGGTSMISSVEVATSGPEYSRSRHPRRNSLNYTFVSPAYPPKTKVVVIGKQSKVNVDFTKSETDTRTEFARGTRTGTKKTTTKTTTQTRINDYVRVHYKPTNFNQEWRTPPLWGVRDSAPYMHDGRAETLLESIAIHGGESAGSRDRFFQLPLEDRLALIAFLETMVAPLNDPEPGI